MSHNYNSSQGPPRSMAGSGAFDEDTFRQAGEGTSGNRPATLAHSQGQARPVPMPHPNQPAGMGGDQTGGAQQANVVDRIKKFPGGEQLLQRYYRKEIGKEEFAAEIKELVRRAKLEHRTGVSNPPVERGREENSRQTSLLKNAYHSNGGIDTTRRAGATLGDEASVPGSHGVMPRDPPPRPQVMPAPAAPAKKKASKKKKPAVKKEDPVKTEHDNDDDDNAPLSTVALKNAGGATPSAGTKRKKPDGNDSASSPGVTGPASKKTKSSAGGGAAGKAGMANALSGTAAKAAKAAPKPAQPSAVKGGPSAGQKSAATVPKPGPVSQQPKPGLKPGAAKGVAASPAGLKPGAAKGVAASPAGLKPGAAKEVAASPAGLKPGAAKQGVAGLKPSASAPGGQMGKPGAVPGSSSKQQPQNVGGKVGTGGGPQSQSQEKKEEKLVAGGQDFDKTDFDADKMGGVDSKKEEENMNQDLRNKAASLGIPPPVQRVREEGLVSPTEVRRRMSEIARKAGLGDEEVPLEAAKLAVDALRDRLITVIADLKWASNMRGREFAPSQDKNLRTRFNNTEIYNPSAELKRKRNDYNEKKMIEERTRDELERGKRAVAVEDPENPGGEKLTAEKKKQQKEYVETARRQDEEGKRHNDMVASLQMQFGANRKAPSFLSGTVAPPKPNMIANTPAANRPTDSGPVVSRSVTLNDALLTFERERNMRKTSLMYRAFLKLGHGDSAIGATSSTAISAAALVAAAAAAAAAAGAAR